MPRHSRSRRHSSTQGIHHIVDEIVSEVSDALKDAESNIRREWSWARDGWQKSRTVRDFKSMKDKLNEVPDRLNDLATDGSCFVQYVFAYSFKAVAVIMMVAGLIAAGDRFSDTPMETENIVAGLSLLVGGSSASGSVISYKSLRTGNGTQRIRTVCSDSLVAGAAASRSWKPRPTFG